MVELSGLSENSSISAKVIIIDRYKKMKPVWRRAASPNKPKTKIMNQTFFAHYVTQ
jgi:hypothetical protein